LEIAHDLAHEMDAQPADASLLQRRCQVGRRRRRWIEGHAAIGKFYLNPVSHSLEPNLDRSEQTLAAPVLQRVGKQFFQGQVQIECHVIIQTVLPAKSRDLLRKVRQFREATV
jgi:hypothetical protein